MTTPTDNKLAEALRRSDCWNDPEICIAQCMKDGMCKCDAGKALREHEAAKADLLDVPLCKKHRKWPCAECGTSHYEGCMCSICQPKNTQEEGNRSKDKDLIPVASAGLPDRLDVPSVTANWLSDEVVDAACTAALAEAVRLGINDPSDTPTKDDIDCVRAALAAAYPALCGKLEQAERERDELRAKDNRDIDAIREDLSNLKTKGVKRLRLNSRGWLIDDPSGDLCKYSDALLAAAADAFSAKDELSIVEQERDAAEGERDSLRADNERLRAELAASGNYVADREANPMSVQFANGRIVRVVGEGYLEVEHANP
jgi:hypothetical protein